MRRQKAKDAATAEVIEELYALYDFMLPMPGGLGPFLPPRDVAKQIRTQYRLLCRLER